MKRREEWHVGWDNFNIYSVFALRRSAANIPSFLVPQIEGQREI